MWTGLDVETMIEQQIFGVLGEDISDDLLREIKSDVMEILCSSDYFADFVTEVIKNRGGRNNV